MKFDEETNVVYKNIAPQEYFAGICPFCGSKELKIRSSRIRKVQELGTPTKKIMVRIEMQTLMCKSCDKVIHTKHPSYPSNYGYSKDIINYALTRYNYHNITGNAIARDLMFLHNVEIPKETVYSWIRNHSEEFIEGKFANNHETDYSKIKSITIDGTYFNTGKDTIGKKKVCDSYQ